MPLERIPLTGPNKNVDEIGLKGYGASLINGYIDEQGNLNRWPGLTLLCDTGEDAPIDGLYWWDEQSWAIAICNGKCFKITSSDGTNAEITGGQFQKGTRVIFGNYGTDLYAANGEHIIKIPTSGSLVDVYDADSDSPAAVTHPLVMDTYLLGNEVDSQKMHRSNVGAPGTWEANYFSAETLPDNIVAAGVADMEIYLLGRRSMEMWRNDGSTPFVRELQGFVESGTIAPYSLTWCGDRWYWLDRDRNIVRLEGRTPVVPSISMNKYIHGFTSVTDAKGDYIFANGRPFYILTFQSEGKTLALDLITSWWSEIAFYDPDDGLYHAWYGNCAVLAPSWNKTLIGSRLSTGRVFYLDNTTYADVAGVSIRTTYRTEHINHGSEAMRKRCNALIFRVKRTNVQSIASAAEMVVKYRDDGASGWKTERTVTLGQVGDTEFRGVLRRLGSYRSRQWEFYISDDAAFVIASVEEHYDLLRS